MMTPLAGTLLDDYRDRLAIPGPRDGGPNDIRDEMPYLLGRAQQYQGLRVLEIGVRSGNSTSAFLAAASRSMGGGHVWSIDKDIPDVPDRWAESGYWTFGHGFSADMTPELLGWPASYHVLFVDGDHSRAGALADLRKYVPYVARGGVVMCHDTKLLSARTFGMPREVALALDEFCGEYHLTARELPWKPGAMCARSTPLSWAEKGGHYGLGVIERPNG